MTKLDRRNFIAALGRSATGIGGLVLPAAWSRSARPAAAQPAGLAVPSWDDVPGCTPSATDGNGQGPFFIHNDEHGDDVDLFRQDIRGRHDPRAEPGTEMQLHLRVMATAAGQCGAMPLPDVAVYVWHCDAQGYYSGFGEPGEQTPDLPYRGIPGRHSARNAARFCRGAGISDANGVVSFRSIFPGWYNGRDIHIHVMVLERDAASRGRSRYQGKGHLYTTQLYFEPALADRVHRASEPYRRRTLLPAYDGSIRGDERRSSGLRMKADLADGVVMAQMQLVLDPARSRA